MTREPACFPSKQPLTRAGPRGGRVVEEIVASSPSPGTVGSGGEENCRRGARPRRAWESGGGGSSSCRTPPPPLRALPSARPGPPFPRSPQINGGLVVGERRGEGPFPA